MLENSPADATQLPTACQPESLAEPARRRSHKPQRVYRRPREKAPLRGAGGPLLRKALKNKRFPPNRRISELNPEKFLPAAGNGIKFHF
jgi:hypothetical protein